MQPTFPKIFKESPMGPDFPAGIPFTVDEADTDISDENEYILCARCRRVITTAAHRIDVNGSHLHTFANPHGIVFEIGCFRGATGCTYQGAMTDDFSWFPGFGWKITGCGTCLTHLGWLFISGNGGNFHGLILDRLVEGKQEG
jgi:hypothetical protein